jgi:thiosulfate dehydrogenase
VRTVLRALVLVASACAPRTPAERGAALLSDPSLSPSPVNAFSCTTCHAVDEGDSRILPGASLRGVLGRPSYWGGAILDPRRAINECLYTFMLAPRRDTLDADDPRGRDLLSYLETLGTEPTEPVAFTIPRALPSPDVLPPGDADRGAVLYDAACRHCHGDLVSGVGRLGTLPPILPDETLAEHGEYAREIAIAKIRRGGFYGIGGTMPPFSLEVLDDAALADLIAYLGF